jgi:Na+-transporting methylmalonyl-CoA/oxaloacetate decarboxylase gamma subunit
MGVEWGFAGQVGVAGFGIVFALLIILAVIIWLTGRLVNRTRSTDEKSDDDQKGA